MKKIPYYLGLVSIFSASFAENIVIDNATTTESAQRLKLVIQWASNGQSMRDANIALISGHKINPDSLQVLAKSGENNFTIPKEAAHFRIMAWSKNNEQPELVTSWVNVIANKVYKLQNDQLIPTVLMSGAGC